MEKKIVKVLSFALLLGAITTSSTFAGKEQSGVIIHKDAIGGSVLSNMPGAVYATPEEQALQSQQASFEALLPNLKNNRLNAAAAERHYDTENNPILIGYWNPNECGAKKKDTYARHTIGELHNSSGGKYLLSYGSATWYNTSGKNALPYRNGSSTTGQNTVDVKMNINFTIRDVDKDKSSTIKRNDFGPNQCPGSRYVKVIADLDKTVFKDLHGNTSDGVFYSRTLVPVENWNP
ncbi:hypothetical protein QJ48_17310 [Paenibacillus sp. A3]|uniref:hypothetical protein n=1 Tax=Paenibacillus sp. A3 TaxID=1337054 RepID=UPI0006D53F00|nr:hypothetical protein [Paenibacillus sp. A3]KPV58242.1 hypothetical protein QJ48_17310 [Paenibacillus sp. A3]